MLPFTMEELNDAVHEGRVTARSHPHLPYTIYNYSAETQYSNRWDEVTLNCRGLILDEDFNIVARSWKKFFNLGQVDLPIQFDTKVEVTEKMDGSLGILYPHFKGATSGRDFSVATRGSFVSEQAIYGTKMWQEKYSHLTIPPGRTFLFEIIY